MRTIFLDRDGVINANRDDHVKSWEEFEFLPGVLAALQRLRLAGFRVFVVTNQAIINRGVVPERVVQQINQRMIHQITLSGGSITDLRYCPHDPVEQCSCRKPHPGMLLDLARAWQVDLSQAYMVGDAWTDIAAAHAVGCRGILVHTGRGADQARLPEAREHTAEHTAADLAEAVEWILREEGLLLPISEVDHATWPVLMPVPSVALRVSS